MSSNEVQPRAGVDYPATWLQFEDWFPDEAACRRFLARVRWPDGFVCPSCGSGDAWETSRGLWMCRSCDRQTSVTAGTIFHRSRIGLRSWFAAMWCVCANKNGVSALGLQRVLGFGSYETAWAWMHKLRRAMVRPDRELLGGPGVTVELDCTFVGGTAGTGVDGPRYFNKSEVAIAVEHRQPKGLGRIRMAHLHGLSRKRDLDDFARAVIAPGTHLVTDSDTVFQRWPDLLGVTHERLIVTNNVDAAHELLPAVHRVAALLKRWLAGTLHHGQSADHLDYYLDEFTFRFNRRTSRSRGLLFYRLVQQAANTDAHPLDDLKAHSAWRLEPSR